MRLSPRRSPLIYHKVVEVCDLPVRARDGSAERGEERACRYEQDIRRERIEIDPAVMAGKPVIRGTRITVELILRKLAEGATEGELLEDYPHLTSEDLRAAIAYGAASVAHEEVVLLSDGPLTTKP